MADPFANAQLPSSDPFASASLPASDPFASAPLQGGTTISKIGQPGASYTPTFPQADAGDMPGAANVTPQPTSQLLSTHPNRSFQGFVDNLGKNAGEIGQGLGVLGSAIVRRNADRFTPRNFLDNPYQAALDVINDPRKVAQFVDNRLNPLAGMRTSFTGDEQTGEKPSFRVLGNQNESSDIPTLVNATGNLLQDIAGNYIDPAMTGNWDKIVQHGYEKPISTGLDAMAGLGMAKNVLTGGVKMASPFVPQAVKSSIAGSVEKGQALGGAANLYAKQLTGQAISNVGKKILATKLGADVINKARGIIKQTAQLNQAVKILAKHDQSFRQELKEQLDWVKEAHDEIPKGAISDADLTDVVTARDLDKYSAAMSGPHAEQIGKFVDRLNQVNNWIAGRLIDAGVMTEEEAQAAKYGPYALRKAQEATGNPNLRQAELTAEDYAAAEQELNDFGIEPAYSGIVTKGISDTVRGNKGALFGGIGKTAKTFAKNAAEADNANQIFREEKVTAQLAGQPLPPQGGKVVGFRTERGGSTYTVNGKSTQRTKGASGGEHQGDVGLKPPSDETLYADPNAVNQLDVIYTQPLEPGKGAKFRFNPDNTIELTWYQGRDASGELIKRQKTIQATTEPAVGLHPIEIGRYGDGRTWRHIGSKITHVEHEAPPSVPKQTPAGPRPGHLKPRVSGAFNEDAHETDAFKAFETRATQSLGFLYFQDALKEIMEHPMDLGHDAVNFPLRANVEQLAGAMGTTAGADIANAIKSLPEVVKLPGRIAKQIGRVMGEGPGGLEKAVLEGPRKILTTTTLGLNPAWAYFQSIQNLFISGYSMFKGPDDLARSLMAYALAFDKRARAAGMNWIYDTHAEKSVGNLPNALVKGFRAVVDTNFAAAQEGDNYFRFVKGMHSLMKQIEEGEPGSRVPLTKAFDLQARIEQIEKAATNPQYAEQAVKDIDKWFGNYGPEMAEKYRTARNLAPYFLWWMHAKSFVETAAVETPVKNAVLAKIAAAAPDQMQQGVPDVYKKMGMVPMYDLHGQSLMGPNEHPLLMGRSGFLPFMQPFELAEQGGQMLTGQISAEDRAGLPPIAPIGNLIIGATGHNPQNLSPWKDPRLIGGKAREDESGKFIDMENTPGVPELLFRSVMPTQERQVRDALAGDLMPSDFTNPLEVAPKRDNADQALRNYTPLQKAFYDFTRTKPTEATLDQETIDAINEKKQKKYRFVAERYQTERSKPVRTVIGKLLFGDGK